MSWTKLDKWILFLKLVANIKTQLKNQISILGMYKFVKMLYIQFTLVSYRITNNNWIYIYCKYLKCFVVVSCNLYCVETFDMSGFGDQ
jgi:hypothetical protein